MSNFYFFTASDERYDVYDNMACQLSGIVEGINETDILMSLASRFNSAGFGLSDFNLRKLGEDKADEQGGVDRQVEYWEDIAEATQESAAQLRRIRRALEL